MTTHLPLVTATEFPGAMREHGASPSGSDAPVRVQLSTVGVSASRLRRRKISMGLATL
jgi:hypothetical protein